MIVDFIFRRNDRNKADLLSVCHSRRRLTNMVTNEHTNEIQSLTELFKNDDTTKELNEH